VLGSTEPRLWTPPLRELTPATSTGFAQIAFARNVLRRPLDPWQEFAAIHGGELLPDGRPRFRIVLILVARQNGKTELLVILTLYWQFVCAYRLILGTSTKLEYAKESWFKAVELAERTPDFDELRGSRRWTRETNGEVQSWTTEKARYKIAASNEEGGRSLTINRLICDELRQHHTHDAWNAAEPAASPDDAQIWALSNAGDDRSIVLNELRSEAIAFIEWWAEHGDHRAAERLLAGEPIPGMVGDPRLGLLEWSAPKDADPTDVRALAMANPNLGRRGTDAQTLLAAAHRAVRAGGKALSGFKTEKMCIRVEHLDPAIDPGAWLRCRVLGPRPAARSRTALCLDIAPDERHATLAGAAVLVDGRVGVWVVGAWDGVGCVDRMRRDHPGLTAAARPQALGWLPNGPGAAFAADMAERPGWPPKGVTVAEIRSEVTAVCMGFAEQVTAGRVCQSDDPLLNAQVGGAERLPRGGGWVFSRRGAGHVDAVYAMAGAVHLARTLPPPVGKPRLVVAR